MCVTHLIMGSHTGISGPSEAQRRAMASLVRFHRVARRVRARRGDLGAPSVSFTQKESGIIGRIKNK